MPRELLKRVAFTQLLIFGGLYLASVATFVLMADGITERFTAMARGPYLLTAIGAQVRLIPAYGVLALVATALSVPVLARFGEVSRARLLVQVLVADVVIALLALGPVLRNGPGLVDTVARKLPAIDLYALYRWHVLDVLTLLFAGLVLFAIASVGPSTPRGVNGRVPRGVNGRMLLVGVALLLAGATTLHRTPPPKATVLDRPNVLIIAADSWRFDRVGVHGAKHADLTPNIDAFSKQAIDLTNLHVATASTLESWVTFFTGQLPSTHGIRSMYPSRDEVRAVDQLSATVPRLLSAAGYDTFVSSDWVGNCFDLVDLGFGTRHVGSVQNFEALLLEATVKAHPLVPLAFGGLPGVLGDVLVPGRSALASQARPGALVDQLFDDVDASVKAKRPFLGMLFLSPTHLPYNSRHPFNVKYGTPGYSGPHRYQVEVTAHELITTGFSPTLPREAIEHVQDLYDDAVSDFDDTVGRVLGELDARGLTQNTLVIITTDHGEDLYDPGSTLGHGTNFFGGDQSTHIPFFLRLPGQSLPSTVSTLTRTVDLAPTLLSALGLPVPPSMEGVNLLPVLRGEGTEPDLISFAETCYLFFPKAQAMTGLTEAERAEVVELSGAADTLEVDPGFRHNLVLRPAYREQVIAAKDRMVRTTRWKLIEIPGKTRPIRRLYDVLADPQQTTNLAGRGLPEEAELAALLARPDCRARHP
ncbi:MAG: sulfatase [Archangium sp.]|nr:sulfatase [Archangium sp.]